MDNKEDIRLRSFDETEQIDQSGFLCEKGHFKSSGTSPTFRFILIFHSAFVAFCSLGIITCSYLLLDFVIFHLDFVIV